MGERPESPRPLLYLNPFHRSSFFLLLYHLYHLFLTDIGSFPLSLPISYILIYPLWSSYAETPPEGHVLWDAVKYPLWSSYAAPPPEGHVLWDAVKYNI